MIAFVSCVGTPATYAACAVRGLQRVAEPDSVCAAVTTTTSIHQAYNEALEHFSAADDLEALVLMHEDVELLEPRFCGLLRHALSDEDVAVVGAVGARGVTSLAWWEGEMAGRVQESRGLLDQGFERTDVDAVDGLLLALSPWAVRNLRFDAETYTGFHAYDVDLCFTARAAGRAVRVADLPVMHHTKGGYGDKAAWDAANARFQAKWGLAPDDAGLRRLARTAI